MRQIHRIHPEDLMNVDVLSESVLVAGVIVVLGLVFALLRVLA
jgi:hypothetical protein